MQRGVDAVGSKRRALVVLLSCVAVVGCGVVPVLPRAGGGGGGRQPTGDPLLPGPLDCVDWRYDGVEPGPLPEEWDDGDDKFTSARDAALARSPQALCGQLGAAVDLAWGVERGSPDVVVAVLDSGIEWQDPAAMADLAPTAHLNRGELPPPAGATGEHPDPYDADGDGRFSVLDYADDPRIGDRNGNGVLDPQDLILTFSDGVDDDGNGYVDDISGWDFLEDDNDPHDVVEYGHGTGEARDAAAAHDGTGTFGMCPECSHLPVRVSDSFIAEGGRFAAGVLYAADAGADVVLDALGAVTNPPQAQQAIDAAYRRGLPVVASMADEQSQHANLPSALNHTIAVNSVTEAMEPLSSVGSVVTGRRDTLALNGCTNHGGIAWITVPSDGCSSEATGNAAGVVGLVQAAARRAGIEPHPDLAAAGVSGPGSNVLSVDEVAQLLRATADDVDFSTPNDVDGANRTRDPYGQLRFPTVRGWDATFGYGRLNAYEVVRAVAAGDVPPEASITSPRWFVVEPTAGTLQVEGRVAAVRSSSYSYRVEWTTGLQAPPHPGSDTWQPIASGEGLDDPVEGVLGEVDLSRLASALPAGGSGAPVGPDGRPDHDRFTVRIRVVVTDAEGRVATTHRHFSVHDDPTSLPAEAVAGGGASSPVFEDLDGDGRDELVVATDDGHVHVRRADGSELAGFPVRTPTAGYWHAASATARAAGIDAPGAAVGVGAPAVADLDGDGSPEVVVSDFEGGVHIWGADGSPRASVATDPALSRGATRDQWNRLKPGIAGSPALGDLDGDGDLEVVVSAMDRHVYAWHHDGTAVPGFPVLVVDPAKVVAVDPASHVVTFRSTKDTGIGGELIATPALGDLDGDGRPEIVVGAQEQYFEQIEAVPGIGLPGLSGNTRLYAIHPDGAARPSTERWPAHPHDHAYLPGWPVRLPMLMTDVLPTIGGGVAAQAAIGDVDGDGEPEVVASSVSGPMRVLDADGTSPYVEALGLPIGLNWADAVPPGSNSTDVALLVAAFGGPALGQLGTSGGGTSGGGTSGGLDVVAPTSGLGRALDTLFPNSQDGDPQLTAWSGRDGAIRNGFPRVTADIAFFVTPATFDVDGDGRHEAVAGNGLHMLDAFRGDGSTPEGWPKFTGGWLVGTPAAGDWDGDGQVEVAVMRRDGVVQVWRTPTAAADLEGWTRFGSDARNSGSVGLG